MAWFTEDPDVTVTLPVYVSPTEITFSATVLSTAPTEPDAFTLPCVNHIGIDLNPGSVEITPCALAVTPTVTSIQPAAFFAGASTAVTITGANFTPTTNPSNCTASVLSVTAGTENVAISDYNVVNSEQITAVVTPQATDPIETATVAVANANLNGNGQVPPSYQLWANLAPASSPVILPIPTIECNTPGPQCTGAAISGPGGTPPPPIFAGQQVVLSAVPRTIPNFAITTTAWSAGGTNIGGYTPTSTSYNTGSVTPTTLTNSGLTTYFAYSGANVPVTFQYCVLISVSEEPCSPLASTTLTITGPAGGTMTFTPYSTSPSIAYLAACPTSNPPEPAGPYMFYGQGFTGSACPGQHPGEAAGITFNSPTGYQNSSGGAFFLVQLISADGISGACCSAPGPGLDTIYPYPPGTTPSNDSPFVPLPATSNQVIRDFSAYMFLMWQYNQKPSIPVPLGYQNWIFNSVANCSTDCGDSASWTAINKRGAPLPGPQFAFVSSSPSQISPANITLVFGYPTWTIVTQ